MALISKKDAKNYPEHYSHKEKMLRILNGHLFLGDLSKSEKLSETKPHLTCHGEFIDMISEINTLLGTYIKGLGCRVEVGGIIFIFNSSKSQKIIVFFQ